MATPTYIPLATTTLASSASSVTFSSIDQSYGDLVLVINGQFSTSVNASLEFQPNGSSTDGTMVFMSGDGSSTFSSTATRLFVSWGGNVSTSIVNIMDYSATNKHKTFLIRDNDTSYRVRAVAGRWANTSAITSLVIGDAGSVSLGAGSTFSLYGIAK